MELPRTPIRNVVCASLLAAIPTALFSHGADAISATVYHDSDFNSPTVAREVGVMYMTPRSVDVHVILADNPADSYCTVAMVRLYSAAGAQLGNPVTIGSVCGGNTATLPRKSISTAAGDIDSVRVYSTKGTNGQENGRTICYRSVDQHGGVPDRCR